MPAVAQLGWPRSAQGGTRLAGAGNRLCRSAPTTKRDPVIVNAVPSKPPTTISPTFEHCPHFPHPSPPPTHIHTHSHAQKGGGQVPLPALKPRPPPPLPLRVSRAVTDSEQQPVPDAAAGVPNTKAYVLTTLSPLCSVLKASSSTSPRLSQRPAQGVLRRAHTSDGRAWPPPAPSRVLAAASSRRSKSTRRWLSTMAGPRAQS